LHYKEDLHRYNSKRKIVNLPPITQEQFEKRKADMAEKQKLAEQSQTSLESSRYCECCRKQINSENAFKQHLQSRKHKENEKVFKSKQKKEEHSESTIHTDDISSSETSMIKRVTTIESKKACLFCNQEFGTIKKNLDHMQAKHSFFIPAIEYVCDLNGLLHYLAEKIQVGLLCIFCDNKGCKAFKTGQAVQGHMTDKGHCMMATLDNEEEFVDYYDFTATYPEELQKKIKDMEEERKKEKEEMGPTREEIKVDENSNEDSNGEDDEWEDIDTPEITSQIFTEDQSIIEGEDLFLSKAVPYQKFNVQARMSEAEREVGGEVRLANGKLIGNRAYKDIYKQNYKPQDSREMVLINRVAAQYRQLNVMQHSWNLDKFKAARERRAQAQYHKLDKSKHLRVGVAANKLQEHFRLQYSYAG